MVLSRKSSMVTVQEGIYEDIAKRSTKRRWRVLLFLEKFGRPQHDLKQFGVDRGGVKTNFQLEGNDLELGSTGTHSSTSSMAITDLAFLELLPSLFGDESAKELPTSDMETKLLSQCQQWYLRFVDSWIEAAWEPLLDGATSNPPGPCRSSTRPFGAGEAAKKTTYTLMNLTAREMRMRERKGLALTEIVTVLQDQGHLRTGDTDHECLGIQMAFTLIGWLTMLYEPVTSPEKNKLQLEQSNTKRRLRLRRSGIIHNFSLDIVSPAQSIPVTQQPLHRLFCRFGNLIPRPDDLCNSREFGSGNATQAGRYWGGDFELESTITVHHVCFHTLQKIVEIQIEWVETLNQHLEFNPGKKTLKLFRYPAFCWMMSRNTGFDSIPGRLFEEMWSRDDDLTNLSPQADDFFREVLLSYRLIFGQDKRSRNAYRKHAAKRDRGNDKGKYERRQHPEDPLLALLCGQSWRSSKSRAIYQAVDLDEEVSKIYTVTDFPFLGKRLLQLQRFSKCQYPHGWIMLWHDRRNLSEWWTIWAVLFIGGGTIIIALLTLAFQIMQVYVR